MKKFISMIVAAFAVMIGLALVAPAANADTSSNGFDFTVTSTSQGTPTVSTTMTHTQQALINGATQAAWQDSNYTGKLTTAVVKAAWPKRIKVNAPGANSSQVIYQQSGHRKIVILKPHSIVRDTGRHNKMRVGMIFPIRVPTVLEYNKASHQYREAAHLVTKSQLDQLQQTASKGGKYVVVGSFMANGTRLYIVAWCGNFIGGHVVMVAHMVFVRFVEDLLMESDAESVAKAEVTYDFSVTCPSTGANFHVQGSAFAYGKASAHVTFTQRTRATVIGNLEVQAKQNISIDQNVEADAQASVHISGSCGSTPPPTCPSGTTWNDTNNNGVVDSGECVTPAPGGTIEIDRMNDLDQSTVDSNGTLHKSTSLDDIDYMVPAGKSATLTIDCGSCRSVVFTSNNQKTVTVNGDGQVHTIQVLYTASTEPGTDTMTVTNTVSGQSPISATTPVFNINPTPTPPM